MNVISRSEDKKKTTRKTGFTDDDLESTENVCDVDYDEAGAAPESWDDSAMESPEDESSPEGAGA